MRPNWKQEKRKKKGLLPQFLFSCMLPFIEFQLLLSSVCISSMLVHHGWHRQTGNVQRWGNTLFNCLCFTESVLFCKLACILYRMYRTYSLVYFHESVLNINILLSVVSKHPVRSGRKSTFQNATAKECWLVEPRNRASSVMVPALWNITPLKIRLAHASWSSLWLWRLGSALEPGSPGS